MIWKDLRYSERVLLVYFAYTAIFFAQARLVSAAIFLLYIGIARFKWDYARDWIPPAVWFVAYKQMGLLAPASHDFSLERQWIVWDRILLREWGLRAGIEAVPGLPALLELSYLLVYAVPPITVAVFYWIRERRRVDAMLVVYSLGLLMAYGQFPFWPSEPPRTVFPGEDAPLVHSVFRHLNLHLVGGYGIHTSVFPSAHVSGAFSAAFSLWLFAGRRRALQIGFTVYAVLVSVATVYGRYHYAVDAVAGFFVAVAAALLGRWLMSQFRTTT